MNRQHFVMYLSLVALPAHRAGTPTEKLIDEYTGCRPFLVHNLGVSLPESYGSVRGARQ